jgi:hypothetical protein
VEKEEKLDPRELLDLREPWENLGHLVCKGLLARMVSLVKRVTRDTKD